MLEHDDYIDKKKKCRAENHIFFLVKKKVGLTKALFSDVIGFFFVLNLSLSNLEIVWDS